MENGRRTVHPQQKPSASSLQSWRRREKNKLEDQKITFAPSCNSREVLPVKVLLTVPKAFPLFRSLFGVPSTGWLKMLNASPRNSMRRPSPQKGNCRKTEASRFQYGAWRNEFRE